MMYIPWGWHSNFSTGSIVVVALGAVVIAGAIVFVIKNKKK